MSYSAVFNAYELLVAQKASIRPNLHSLSAELFPSGGPTSKSLVEITGASNSGKTLLLSELIAQTVLPTYFNGKNSNVVLIDLDHKFSVPHLMKVAEKIVKNSGEKASPEDMQFTIELRMQSVQIINCYMPEQFEISIEMIDDLLVANHDIALLAIDNVGAFYWLDTEKKLIRKETHYKNYIAKLKSICRKHNIVCAYTVDSSYIQSKGLRPNVDYHFEMVPKQKESKIEYSLNMNAAGHGNQVEKQVEIDEFGMHFN